MTSSDDIAALQRDNLPVTEVIAVYEAGTEELRAAVAGLTDAQLRARPIPGKWSTLEVVCHIADGEQFFADRMKRTAAMDRPLLIGADGFRYPDALRYQDHDLQEEIHLVDITRRQMARVLRLLSPDAWHRTAVHTEIGLVTLRQLVLYASDHLQHHLGFIVEKRTAMKDGSW